MLGRACLSSEMDATAGHTKVEAKTLAPKQNKSKEGKKKRRDGEESLRVFYFPMVGIW